MALLLTRVSDTNNGGDRQVDWAIYTWACLVHRLLFYVICIVQFYCWLALINAITEINEMKSVRIDLSWLDRNAICASISNVLTQRKPNLGISTEI